MRRTRGGRDRGRDDRRVRPRPLLRAPAPSTFLAKNSSAVRVFVCCSLSRSTPFEARNARVSAATWNASRRALRRELEDPRAVRIEPHLGDHLAVEALGRELQLEDEDRARGSRGRRARVPRARAPRRTPAAPSRRACASARLPARRLARHRRPGVPSASRSRRTRRAIASTSTPKFGDRRSPSGARTERPAAASRPSRRPSSGPPGAHDEAAAGRAPGPACRRRTPGGSPPASGSSPSARMVERWVCSGTVSFSSTLSAPLISPRSSCSSLSPSAGRGFVVVAIARPF